MFASVRFSAADARTYTYTCGFPVAPGDRVTVETKDGTKDVIVAAVDLPEPPFACKPILGMAESAAPVVAMRGHNNPPDPLDEAIAPFGDAISEAENWLDGEPVQNEAQMKAVDALLRDVKAAKKAVAEAEESEAKPIYDQWKAAKARFAPTITDLDRIAKGLIAIVDTFKRKLAAEKAEAERKARAEAEARMRAAAEAARQADAGNIEAQRAAAQAQAEADEAVRLAALASKDTVKGLRQVTRYAVDDHKALLNWIARNRRDDLTAFVDEWAKRHHKDCAGADGLRVWLEKEAF